MFFRRIRLHLVLCHFQCLDQTFAGLSRIDDFVDESQFGSLVGSGKLFLVGFQFCLDGIDLAVLGLGNKDETAVRLVVRDIALVANEVVHRQHQLILHGEVIQRTGVGDGVHSLDGGNSGIKVCGVGFIAHDDVMLSAEEAASEDAAAEVLSLAAGAESAEEPQAASSMAQHRITGISFFIGQVLLLL